MKVLLVWAVLAQGGDITTSTVGLQQGCREIGLFSKYPYTGIALKAGATALLPIVIPRLSRRRPKLAKWLIVGVAASGTLATGWNAYQIPRC